MLVQLRSCQGPYSTFLNSPSYFTFALNSTICLPVTLNCFQVLVISTPIWSIQFLRADFQLFLCCHLSHFMMFTSMKQLFLAKGQHLDKLWLLISFLALVFFVNLTIYHLLSFSVKSIFYFSPKTKLSNINDLYLLMVLFYSHFSKEI